ncbi:ribulose-phosphate 3-epimerase, partial [Candidatus Fermentibacterales bacterium]|nr:ribulose-phosphate 3-epimerase [Candidatus Fermentibacterales bacterium]
AGLRWAMPHLDLVLVMTVNPGYGGQRHLAHVAEKLPLIRRMAADAGRDGEVLVSVDGGVSDANARSLRESGADILVAGSFLFGAEDMASAVASLR